jgi:hypothetical protein
MAIFFSCSCGQSLRAEENEAGGFARCLFCGCLAQVPDLDAANRGLDINCSPPTPTEASRPMQALPPIPVVDIVVTDVPMPPPAPWPYRRSRQADGDGADFVQASQQLTHFGKTLRARSKHGWTLEVHFSEFVLYPLRALPLVLCLALAWASLIAFLMANWPPRWEALEVVPRLPLLLVVFLLLGYTWAFLARTFAAGVAGEAGRVARPDHDRLIQAARAGMQAVWCFLAGPIVPAAVAFFFWLNSGDFETVDWLIVWELGVLSVGYWFLALMAVRERNAYGDACPSGVAHLLRRLGYRMLAAALLVAVVMVGHGILMFGALESMHQGARGWFFMVLLWAALLFWLVLLLRWFGVSSYRAARNMKTTLAPT